MAAIPETRFVRAGDVDIAYQVVGSGPIDLVAVPGWVSHLEVAWELPEYARFLERMASFSRLLLFDKRGTGLSDRVGGMVTLEDQVEDIRAVMDAVGSPRAALAGWSDSAAMVATFAALYPERASALALGSLSAKTTRDGNSPWGADPDFLHSMADSIEATWGQATIAPVLAPSHADDERFLAWWRRWERSSATPNSAAALYRWNMQIDIRAILPLIQCPTLVVHRPASGIVDAQAVRWAPSRSRTPRYVELPGVDALPFVGDSDAVLDVLQEFLTGELGAPVTERVLATVLFTDIVGSTERAEVLGDQAWRDLLAAHDAEVRHCLARFGGHEVNTTGDGFLATFDGPARAIRGACAIRDAVHGLGLEIRAGLHTGEVERHDGGIAGLAVHVGARVAALAGPNEVLVTSTVKDLVLGSGQTFADRGIHHLKGVQEEWHVFAVTEC